MIYLIDDRKTRQNDFGWSKDKLNKYSALLTTLYDIHDITEIGEALYDEDNVIMYHESFLDFTSYKSKAVAQRNKLLEKADKNEITVAFFSGSRSSKSLSLNMAYLPVSVLYQNLDFYIQQYNQGRKNLKYLLFGVNPEIEEELEEKRAKANNEIEDNPGIIAGNNLFIRPSRRYIQNAIMGAEEVIITSSGSTDEELSMKVGEWLNESVYDNVFVPLCFGNTLSNFNGLRLATFIRCLSTKNQLTRIFVYGFVGLEYLIDHECFNILKTKNVVLVDYAKKAFERAASITSELLTFEELPKELKKLNLNPPGDNHSVANEWGVFQLARNADVDIKNIEGFDIQKLSSLYFVWLMTKNSIDLTITMTQKQKQKKYAETLPGIKVLGHIDISKFSKKK